MAVVARGAGGTMGIGAESTWGTEVARGNWMRMISMGLKRIVTNAAEPDLGRLAKASTTKRHPYVVSDFAGGPISFCGSYNDSTILLLAQALGAVATTGPVSTKYTHTITLASPPPVGMTLEQISGVAPTGSALEDLMAEVFEGCKIASTKISLTAGGLLMIDMDVIGQTSQGLEDAGTPTYSAGLERIQPHHTTGLTLGGTLRQVNSLVINVERDLQRNQEFGSLLTSEPYEGADGIKVTGEIRTKWQSQAFDSALLARSQADIVIPFVGSGDNSLDITLHNIQIDDVDRAVNDRGAIEQVIKFTTYADGSDEGLTMAFGNSSSAAGAN